MNCPKCNTITVSPQGLTEEKVCLNCGLTLNKLLNTISFNQLNPEWQSHWRENDLETLSKYLTTLRTESCQLSLPISPFTKETTRSQLLHLILKQYGKNLPLKEIVKELSLDKCAIC